MFLSRRLAAGLTAMGIILSGAASAQDGLFGRGGYVVADTEDLADVEAFYGAVGGRWDLSALAQISLEGEFLFANQDESFDLGGSILEADAWLLLPNAALRWQWPIGAFRPYLSAGVGPGIDIVSVEAFGFDDTESDVFLGYTGRAGVEFSLAPKFGFEAGYRYIGSAEDGRAGLHAAEIGLNLRF